jgi:hypothetical protein
MPSEVTTYTPTRGTRIHPEGLRLPFEGKDPRSTEANKSLICRKNGRSLLKAFPLRVGSFASLGLRGW